MFSSRGPADRDPNSFTRALENARARGQHLLDLTVSNPTHCGFDGDGQRLGQVLSNPAAARYDPDPRGLRTAREAVLGLWAERGISSTADRVLLTSSTSEAYGWLFKLLCDPGDEVLAPRPSYPLFDLLASFEAVALRPYPLRYDGGWHIDLGALRAAITSRTRAVLVVSPNNPTGSYLTKRELGALAELGIPIVCDEVFADYPLRDVPDRVRSVLDQPTGLVFALDGLSKLAALPQLKLGWITVGGSPALAQEAVSRLELIADSYLSVGTPVQLAAPRLVAERHAIQRAITERLRTNLGTLRSTLRGSAATVLDVHGGWYAVMRLPAVATEMQWVLGLLEDGVVVQPGWFFDFETEPFVVISLLTPVDDCRAAAEVIAARVARCCG
jgi:alanine-synthesizing transaminase